MLPRECLDELRSCWLPNLTDAGLNRLIDMLEKGSPFLIHGCFTRSVPMGCLATHAAWHHPLTAHLTLDAGITWLHRVAGLNPVKITGDGADILRDRPFVIVQNNDETSGMVTNVIERFITSAAGKSCVTSHDHDILFAAAPVASDRHTQAGR